MVTAMQKLLQVLLVFSVAFLKSSLSFPFKEKLLKLDNLPCHAEALKVCIILVHTLPVLMWVIFGADYKTMGQPWFYNLLYVFSYVSILLNCEKII